MSTAFPKRRLTLLLLAAALATGSFGAFSASAQAACSYPDAEQVFAPWNDSGWYQLAPDGGLAEGGNGWTLEGGAELVADPGARNHEGEQEETALRLTYGASAVSPPVCVDPNTPSFRFMMRNIGDDGAKLRVTVVYENTVKVTKAKSTDIRSDENEWLPSPPLKLDTGDEPERVARITFSAKDQKSAYLVDDLYVDPFARY
jgi:hypothetical protein